jgi:hypothetical protein
MHRYVGIASLFLFSLSIALGSQGQSQGRAQNREVRESPNQVERIIRDWFGNSHNLEGLPPGLAKRDRLPPGLQRQLDRNGRLPPGLEKRIHDLPEDLVLRLPRLPDHRRWIYLAGNVILLDETSSTILEIVEGVL